MRRIVSIVGCFFLMLSAAVAQERLVFTTAAMDPFHNEDRTAFLDEIFAEIGERNGYSFEIVHMPAERAILDANAGLSDGEALRIAGLDKAYPNLIRVPEPLADIRFSAFTVREDIEIFQWDDLADLAVAYITGWKIFETNVNTAAQITKVRDPKQLFQLLERGRTDVALYEGWQGAAYILDHKHQGIHRVDPPLVTIDMFMYVHKKHSDLVPMIAKTLHQMKIDGSYETIFNRIMGPLIDE